MATQIETSPAVASLTRVHVPPRQPSSRTAGRVGLQDVSIRLRRGEIISLLDANIGGGAYTVLALFAGYAQASAGEVALSSKLVDGAAPYRRHIGVVSHDLALFPGHTVAQHARFSPGVTAKRRDTVLERLGLSDFANSPVGELTRSQQVRVALARALAREPKVLLLEDPPGGLSADVRLKPLLRALAAETGLAILHACNDVGSTHAFADRIGVLQFGWLHQLGTPQALYDRPDSLTVAQAMGPLNLLNGSVVDSEDDVARIRITGGPIVEARTGQQLQPNEPCILALRPERIAVAALRADEFGEGAVPVRLIETLFVGDQTKLRFRMDSKVNAPSDGKVMMGPELFVTRPSSIAPPRGQTLCLAWQPHHANAFRKEVA